MIEDAGGGPGGAETRTPSPEAHTPGAPDQSDVGAKAILDSLSRDAERRIFPAVPVRPEQGGTANRLRAVALLIILLAFGIARAGEAAPVRVRIVTSSGPFTVELYPERAPRTVARFLARSGLEPLPEGTARAAAYAGLTLCESRAHGFFVFGCVADAPPPGRKPLPPGNEPPQADEIDAETMGLAGRTIAGNPERDWLWQQEIIPRARALEDSGRPVPDGLRSLVDAVRRDGTAAFARLDGMTRKAYLEALGYRFAAGASPYPVLRGALATANLWPGEADGRFLVALADLPERDGRATVFGRVIEGWDTLDAIARIPVEQGHRPRSAVAIVRMERVR